MNEIDVISLENEMDLVLAHKRSLNLGQKLGLTLATCTTFATAISEIARTVIEHTNNGSLSIGLVPVDQRFALSGRFTFGSPERFVPADGYFYAQKLVPEFSRIEHDGITIIELRIGIPRSINLNRAKITALAAYFKDAPPINAYEEIKKRNRTLNRIAEEKEEELKRSKIIDQKKTEFISVASHEIKTPITVIKAYSQMIKVMKEGCSDQVKSIVDKIDGQTSKLLALVQQLLDVSKFENGHISYQMERVQIGDLIADMVAVMKHITPNHEFRVSVIKDIKVSIDKLRMEQVFSNLLGNAAKYSRKNTVISIKAGVDTQGFAQISVSDQGIGMNERDIRSVFEKFYRSDDVLNSHAGLGMGLYIASKIVTDHGGRIWVESTPGTGSTFHFTIPASS
ncbi:sensor histidine kinase [Pedobacter sp. SYP-B3415]|uniref:ATP-binding protein n=1 Tax=Pedobacter sp. SYP-B3415 TaxID=2496641 RepID=UPI00101C3990|nr:sensor histidine kinase [Pedobacter sp. SYP-B3415]